MTFRTDAANLAGGSPAAVLGLIVFAAPENWLQWTLALGLLLPFEGHLPLSMLTLDTRFGLAPLPLQPRFTDLRRLLGNQTLFFSGQLTFPGGDFSPGAYSHQSSWPK